jgi:hypothetical protein
MARRYRKRTQDLQRAPRPSRRRKATGAAGVVKTYLLNPEVKLGASGKVESITGTCSEPGCTNVRTIKPQDAFQVRRCGECQKKALYARTAANRKAKREAAAKAKAAAHKRSSAQTTMVEAR